MTTTNFKVSSISKLIRQRGETLLLCQQNELHPENLELGLVAEKNLVCRKVRGYATPENAYSIGLGGFSKSQTGNYTCYFVVKDVSSEEFSGSCRVVRAGKIYQVEYKELVLDRGQGQLHSVRLINTPRTDRIDLLQPDEIIDIF